MPSRLIHDCAWACSESLMEVVSPCLREEDHADCFHEFYTRVAAAIEAYEVFKAREQARLKPSKN